MAKQVFVVEEQKDRSGWAIIFVAAALIAFWKWIVVTAMFALFMVIIRLFYRYLKEREDRRISRDAAIAVRADYQNQLVMAGDPLGIEGEYPASTMPLTSYQMCEEDCTGNYNRHYHMNLDDHNDGLKEWN